MTRHDRGQKRTQAVPAERTGRLRFTRPSDWHWPITGAHSVQIAQNHLNLQALLDTRSSVLNHSRWFDFGWGHP